MQEGEEELSLTPETEAETGPGAFSRVGLILFMTAAAAIFVAALLVSLSN